MDLILRNSRVRGHDKPVDIAINNGIIARIAPKISGRPRQVIDCAGKLVSPPFTDIHVHLDAVLTVGQPRFNQSGTLIEGIEIWAERKKPLDLHIDETDDPNSRFTEVLAAETIKRGLTGRVTASHTTSMHSVDNAHAFKLIRLIKRAGLHMVTNPCDNSVLQGRFDTYPKRRGHTRVKELLAAGVNVGIGHDSIMDPWYPLGVGDPVQVAFVWIHYGQMSGASEIPQVWDMITKYPAKAFGATGKDYGIAVGNPADLVLLDAETEFDALRRIAPRLLVMKAGQIVVRTTPSETALRPKG